MTGDGICGAKRKDGGVCHIPSMANGRCWRHGGKTPKLSGQRRPRSGVVPEKEAVGMTDKNSDAVEEILIRLAGLAEAAKADDQKGFVAGFQLYAVGKNIFDKAGFEQLRATFQEFHDQARHDLAASLLREGGRFQDDNGTRLDDSVSIAVLKPKHAI